MSTCMLCNSRANSREHYIPCWLSDVTQRTTVPLIYGGVSEGQILHQAPRGTAKNAVIRNLCRTFNGNLGTYLEDPVRGILSPLLAPERAVGLVSHLNTLLERERLLLAWWAVLRALQLNAQPRQFVLHDETRKVLLEGIRAIAAATIPPFPKSIHVQVASASDSNWGFTLSAQLFDRARGIVESHGSFLWGMQANRFLMIAASLPNDATILKDQGWSYGLVPFDSKPPHLYKDLGEMVSRSHIDTSLHPIFIR